MNRVHKMIAGATIVEKAERAKQHTIFKATRGYDPLKWVKAKARIRDEELLALEYQNIEIVPPTKGYIDLLTANLFTKKRMPSSAKEVGRQSAMTSKYRESFGLNSLSCSISQLTELKKDSTRRILKPPKGPK